MARHQDDKSNHNGNREESQLIASSGSIFSPANDPDFKQQVQKLHQLTVYGRWFVVVFLWLTIGTLSLWSLRADIALLRQHFTWVALRYGLAYNLLSAIGLGLCLGMTTAVLVWQSRNILWGLSQEEKKRLEHQVCRIRHQGSSHPLWKWVCH